MSREFGQVVANNWAALLDLHDRCRNTHVNIGKMSQDSDPIMSVTRLVFTIYYDFTRINSDATNATHLKKRKPVARSQEPRVVSCQLSALDPSPFDYRRGDVTPFPGVTGESGR